MSWVFLYLAIVFEVLGTAGLRLSEGLTRWPYVAGATVSWAACLSFLALALEAVPVGIAYAIWSGFGTVLIVLFGDIEDFAWGMEQIGAGRIWPLLDRALPLHEAAAVHRLVANNDVTGNIVLLPWAA